MGFDGGIIGDDLPLAGRIPSMYAPKRRRLSETPDLVEGFQVAKALLLDLMTVHGVDIIQLDAAGLKAACNMVGTYELDEAGGILFRKES